MKITQHLNSIFYCLVLVACFPVISAAEDIVDAGNFGDYYANYDGCHVGFPDNATCTIKKSDPESNPDTGYPGLSYLTVSRGFGYGIWSDKVVVGNASLATYRWTSEKVSSNYWMSMVRAYAMGGAWGSYIQTTYNQYRNNNMFWYPEHRDHDLRDNYHAMTPTVNLSQGSSGSERDELLKTFQTLAAFRSDTKELLKTQGLLIPALQMIMRRTRVASDEEYLTGKAHPSVFGNYANSEAMQQMANEMQADNIPPLVELEVLDDSYTGEVGKNIFNSYSTQRKLACPASISHVWKNHNYTNKVLVSAQNAFDANDLPITMHWKVLRGDPEHVRIIPQNNEKSIVEIEFDYHPETTIPDSTRLTNMVVVGAFAYNGHYYSAPAFVTSYTIPTENRIYDEEKGLLLEVSYNNDIHPLRISDDVDGAPPIWTKDVFHYDANSKLSGWTRYDEGETFDFTPEGQLIVAKDAGGRPLLVQDVSYYGTSQPVYETIKEVETLVSYKRLGTWQKTGEPFVYGDGGKDLENPSQPQNLELKTRSS